MTRMCACVTFRVHLVEAGPFTDTQPASIWEYVPDLLYCPPSSWSEKYISLEAHLAKWKMAPTTLTRLANWLYESG